MFVKDVFNKAWEILTGRSVPSIYEGLIITKLISENEPISPRLKTLSNQDGIQDTDVLTRHFKYWCPLLIRLVIIHPDRSFVILPKNGYLSRPHVKKEDRITPNASFIGKLWRYFYLNYTGNYYKQ